MTKVNLISRAHSALANLCNIVSLLCLIMSHTCYIQQGSLVFIMTQLTRSRKGSNLVQSLFWSTVKDVNQSLRALPSFAGRGESAMLAENCSKSIFVFQDLHCYQLVASRDGNTELEISNCVYIFWGSTQSTTLLNSLCTTTRQENKKSAFILLNRYHSLIDGVNFDFSWTKSQQNPSAETVL